MLNKNNVSRIIAVTLLVSLILYFCFATIHITHDCTHDSNCHTCSLISRVTNHISGSNPKLVKVIPIIIFFVFGFIDIVNKIIDKKASTPIGLKVELIS